MELEIQIDLHQTVITLAYVNGGDIYKVGTLALISFD